MRPLRAVLVERATPRLVELLAAALDGSGPAIAPLDAGLPPARLAGLIDALGPDSVQDTEGVTSARSGPHEGVAEGTAVVVGTSGSTGVPKGVELSAAALRHSARASLGRVDAEGRLTVRGRADDVITTGGHKVVPGEVAAALQSCPGVREAVVVGQPDPEWGERVVAVVVPADPADPPNLELLRRHVRERLPRYAIPSRVVMVDAVPMLPSGKYDIVRLRQELLRREQTEAESVTY